MDIEFNKTVEQFAKQVNEQYKPKAIYLYGSHVKGTATPYSDIDIAVIFEPLYSESRLDIISNLLSIASKYDANIEPNVFIDDGEYCRFSLLSEVMETGKLIKI